MQPDLAAYGSLCGMELARAAAAEGLDGRTAVVLTRIAAGIALSLAQHGPYRAALHEALPEQLRLLTDTAAYLRGTGQIPPAFDPDTLPTEITQRHEALAALQSDCIARISQADPALGAAARDLLARSVAFEQTLRQRMHEAMTAVKTGHERHPRGEPPDAAQSGSIDDLIHHVEAAAGVKIDACAQLFSGSSKQAYVLQVRGGDWPERAVLRRRPVFSIVESDFAAEFDALSAAYEAALPVPRPLLLGPPNAEGRAGFLITGFAAGRAHTQAQLGGALPEVLLAAARLLGRIQSIDLNRTGFARQAAHPLREAVLARISDVDRIWRRDRVEPSVMIESAFAWLRANIGLVSSTPLLVHGDFDLRNMLIENGAITSMLDWEFARIGSPAEDLAYIRYEITRAGLPWEAFVASYEHSSSRTVDPREMAFFEVWAWVWRLVIVVTAYGGFCGGRHADFLFASTRLVEYEDHLDHLARALPQTGIAAGAPDRRSD